MGKLKQMLIEDDLSFIEDVSDMDTLLEENFYEESHYWTLVDNVAQWMFENKSVSILDDIEKKYLSIWKFK